MIKTKPNSKESFPFVTVIIPIRNEARYIEQTLNSVLAQDYSHKCVEVLILDGMSNDGTRKICEEIIQQVSIFPIQILDNPKNIVPSALNIGFRHAKGDVVIRVDGHCEIAPNYITECVKHLLEKNGDENRTLVGVGGPIETVGETAIAKTISIAMSSVFGVGRTFGRTVKNRKMVVDTIAFPAYKHDIINRFGEFDEELLCNEDDEYHYRICKHGGQLVLAPSIRSRYYCRDSFAKLWHQYIKYGLWKVRVLQKHPHQIRLHKFVPPVFVGSLLISLFLAVLWPLVWYIFTSILGIYLFANLIASLWAMSRNNWNPLFWLPVTYAIIHIGYGLGFLIGLVKFAHKWNSQHDKVPGFLKNLL